MPENMSHHNQSTPVLVHAIDSIGFRLDWLIFQHPIIERKSPMPTQYMLWLPRNHHNLTTLWNYGNHSSVQRI